MKGGKDIDSIKYFFKNAFKTKIGFEYLFQKVLALRCGFTYDKGASDLYTSIMNVDKLVDIDVDKFIILGGIGYNIKGFGMDLAILKGFGKGKRSREGCFVNPIYNMNPITIGVALKINI